MAFATDVATAKAAGHDVKRKLFLGDGAILVLLRSTTTLATLTDGWYLGRKEYEQLKPGPSYFKLYVDDLDGTRLAHLKAMNSVRINGAIYKLVAKDSFISMIPSYEFKVYPTGEKV